MPMRSLPFIEHLAFSAPSAYDLLGSSTSKKNAFIMRPQDVKMGVSIAMTRIKVLKTKQVASNKTTIKEIVELLQSNRADSARYRVYCGNE